MNACERMDGKKPPHVRGEDDLLYRRKADLRETPPRAWGRPWWSNHNHGKTRNTPTCVGKTSISMIFMCPPGKHPHVRGEDTPSGPQYVADEETPPRAWGRLSKKVVDSLSIGNTPTCVGKTLRDYSLFLLSRQNNIETSSFSDTSCSPDNSMSWRFGSPMP